MANTGNFIWNVITISGNPSSPFTIPIPSTIEQIYTILEGALTVEQCQNLLDTRIVENSPECLPACLSLLDFNELPVEGTLDQVVGISIHGTLCGVATCIDGTTNSIIGTLMSLYFKDEVKAQIITITATLLNISINTSVFSVIDTSLFTYEFDETDITFATPDKTTTDLAEFNAFITGKATGYIKITTSQSSFLEGGAVFLVNEIGATVGTNVVVDIPLDFIDKDVIINIPKGDPSFQLTSVTSDVGTDTFGYGFRDAISDDKTDFSLANIAALNAELATNSTKDRQVHIITNAVSGKVARNLTIVGSGMINPLRYIENSYSDRESRMALNENAKDYDGLTNGDIVPYTSWTAIEHTQPTTFFAVVYINAIGNTMSILDTAWSENEAIHGQAGIAWRIRTNGQVVISIIGQTFGEVTNIASVGSLPIGYSTICVTYTGIKNLASSVKIYINGASQAVSLLTGTLNSSSVNGENPFRIGYNVRSVLNPALRYFFDGKIRIAELIDRVFTPAEARQAHNQGTTMGIPSLSEYLAAVEFNKTSGNLTEVTGTPALPFTNIGGNTYPNFY